MKTQIPVIGDLDGSEFQIQLDNANVDNSLYVLADSMRIAAT